MANPNDPKQDGNEFGHRAVVTNSRVSFSGPRVGDNERGHYIALPGESISLCKSEFDQLVKKDAVRAA